MIDWPPLRARIKACGLQRRRSCAGAPGKGWARDGGDGGGWWGQGVCQGCCTVSEAPLQFCGGRCPVLAPTCESQPPAPCSLQCIRYAPAQGSFPASTGTCRLASCRHNAVMQCLPFSGTHLAFASVCEWFWRAMAASVPCGRPFASPPLAFVSQTTVGLQSKLVFSGSLSCPPAATGGPAPQPRGAGGSGAGSWSAWSCFRLPISSLQPPAAAQGRAKTAMEGCTLLASLNTECGRPCSCLCLKKSSKHWNSF